MSHLFKDAVDRLKQTLSIRHHSESKNTSPSSLDTINVRSEIISEESRDSIKEKDPFIEQELRKEKPIQLNKNENVKKTIDPAPTGFLVDEWQ